MGLGLAPFRGGLIQFANAMGTQTIVRRLGELSGKHGPRFTPAPLLQELAINNQPIASTIERQTPGMEVPLEKHHANI
jgi:3-hydroxyacyl-CoA dehydrogenase/enoyl-CoA hydratase/3-hydroxybutyryl-CoA epimerase